RGRRPPAVLAHRHLAAQLPPARGTRARAGRGAPGRLRGVPRGARVRGSRAGGGTGSVGGGVRVGERYEACARSVAEALLGMGLRPRGRGGGPPRLGGGNTPGVV